MKVTATTFRDPLLVVLGDLTGLRAGVHVAIQEVQYDVCEVTGIPMDSWGEDTLGRPRVRMWILQAFNRKLKPKGLVESPKRGYWTLTERGVQAAFDLMRKQGQVPDNAHHVSEPL